MNLLQDAYGDDIYGGCACEYSIERIFVSVNTDARLLGGRKKSACCQIVKPPIEPEICSISLCDSEPGYCPSDDDDESADQFTSKRDLESLEKRGPAKQYDALLSAGLTLRILSRAYPRSGALFNGNAARDVLRSLFRLPIDECAVFRVDQVTLPTGPDPPFPPNTRPQTEHLIDASTTWTLRACVC